MKLLLVATALAAPLFLVQDAPPRDAAPVAEVGKPAPSFRLNDQEGEIQEVGGKHAQWTVLAFYPKALTGG